MIIQKIIFSTLVMLQIIGPSWIVVLQTSEAFAREDSNSQARIAGLRGVVTVTPKTNDRLGYAPEYKSSLDAGDVITTEEESIAELLVENQGLVTVQEYSEAILDRETDGSMSVNLQVGALEWSLPLKNTTPASVTVSTPNIRATTKGGLITADVQPTLGDTVKNVPRESYLVLTRLRAQTHPPGKVALLETFCAKEGTLELDFPGVQSGVREQKEVSAGQCVGFLNGSFRAIGDEYQIADWRAICAVGSHCDIPEATQKDVKKAQVELALSLEKALVGAESKAPEIDEQVVLATTGLSLAASTDGMNPGVQDIGDTILPTTGVDPIDSVPPAADIPSNPGVPAGPGTPPGGGPGGPTPGVGMPTPGVGVEPPLAEIFPPSSGSPVMESGNIQQNSLLIAGVEIPGGWGSLTFDKGNFTADKELLLADSGLLTTAPHLGKAPQNSLVVTNLSPNGFGSPSNQKLPLEFGSFPFTFPDFEQVKNSDVEIGTDGFNDGIPRGGRHEQLSHLTQFARQPLDPENILVALPDASAEFPCLLSPGSCYEIILAAGLGGLETPDPKPEVAAGIDASIQVRSASSFDPTPGDNKVVTLQKGVILRNTQVTLAVQEKTSTSFLGLAPTLGQAIQGSAVSILGELGEPALVNAEDRILGILDGSKIQGASDTLTTALLAVLDGTLRGPVTPSVIGKNSSGADILRSDVAPIIEVIDGSAEITTAVMVGSTATASQSNTMDRALHSLVEASSPLIAMIRGNVTTASDFGRVAGQNATLEASLVPGDALVRLNASDLMVNGNLFSVTGGAQLNVIGNLLSVQGNSTVTLAGGAFVDVGAGSIFSLTNGALVDFGTGTNAVNVSNSLCAGGGCFAPFANPGWQVAGNPADFSAPNGYNPFVDVGSFSDGSVNTLNIGQDAAILSVAPGGSIQIQ